MSNYEETRAQQLENMIEDMLNNIKKLDIDKLETKFERSCESCRLRKDCGQCKIKAIFVKALWL
jgi:radical SAM protein with 4Fe4S-binding SPASM domain